MTGLITAPDFDINRTEEYKLSIQVSLDGFSFSATDIQKNELLALENHNFKLRSDKFLARHFTEWASGKDYLHKRYGHINLLYDTDKFTFIPTAFYDNKLHDLPASLALGNPDGSSYTTNNHENGKLIFQVDVKLANVLANYFPKCEIRHPLTALSNALHEEINAADTVLLTYFRPESFSMILFNNNKIQLLNSYTCHDAGDFLYYATSALSRLGFIPKRTDLVAAGEISPLSKLYSSFVKYFRNSRFLLPAVNCNRNIFKEPLYRHVVLF